MFSLHTHTGISSASRGFADSSIKLEDLVKKAIEIGLSGIAITDHESVGSFVQAKKLEKKYNFPIMCGNEIYLVSNTQYDNLRYNYEKGMYFPHFLLVALDEIGNEQLRILSTKAWVDNGFYNSGLLRTPTRMSDVKEIIGNNKGHVIGSTACIGGQLAKWILDSIDNPANKKINYNNIKAFLNWCKNTFGEDNFYLETQPSHEKEQLIVNETIKTLSKEYDIPYIITTDAHYLSKDLLSLHSKFLTSNDENDEDTDRNVEEFYKTAYLMSESEVRTYFEPYWSKEEIDFAIENTIKIGNKAKKYEMKKKQVIPKIKFKEKWEIDISFFPLEYKNIHRLINSEFEQDKYLIFLIENGVKKLISKEKYSETFKRVDLEVEELWEVSKIIEDRLGGYFVTMAKLIEIMWNEGDSLVGVGRGSCVSSIVAYLLEITQVNPLEMPVEMPFWRFIDRARPELADIDVDSQSDRRLQIFIAVKKYFEELGGEVINCCTYGTIGAKSAIQTSGRGLGLSVDDYMDISALIPSERGEVWSLHDTYYGNEEKGRKKIKEFINLVNQFEGLLDLAMLIEGVIINRGVHASGVFITNTVFEEFNAKMLSPKGIITSQWDLHDSEEHGLVKYDFLTISALTKIRLTLEMLVEKGYIDKKNTLKETYESVLNPHKIDYSNDIIWEKMCNNEVVDLFQFDSITAMQTVSEIKPHGLIEATQSNSLMRLQKQEDALETPTETYARFKNNIQEWYVEMDLYNVPKKDQEILKNVLGIYKGVADTQEAIMILSRVEEFTGFSVKDSHKLRKAIAKKSKSAYEEVEKMFYKIGKERNVDINTLNYIWKIQISRQKGYAFSILHCIAYTFIALQELVLYTQFPSIYWNTACLTVNSGGIEEEDMESVLENSNSNNKKATKYDKIAKAIGDMMSRGVKIVLPDINKAKFSFIADEDNNQIIFGMKGIAGIGDDIIKNVIENRPYRNFEDFCNKNGGNSIKNSHIINFIKCGAFDTLETISREELLKEYLIKTSDVKNEKLDMKNYQKLIEYKLIPDKFKEELKIINYKNYVINNDNFIRNSSNFKTKKEYIIKAKQQNHQQMTEEYFNSNFASLLTEGKHYWINEEGYIVFNDKDFEKIVSQKIEKLKEWISTDEALNLLNASILNDLYEKHGEGNISKWEMDTLCFYYHEHELVSVNAEKYNIVDFNSIPEEPNEIATYNWGGKERSQYEIFRIAGTVLGKNKTKHTVTLLTTTGVVTVKFYSGTFAHYDKRITESTIVKEKEVNKVIDKSWFSRGSKIFVVGFRRGEMFLPKKYKNSVYSHTVQKISNVYENGDVDLISERKIKNE